MGKCAVVELEWRSMTKCPVLEQNFFFSLSRCHPRGSLFVKNGRIHPHRGKRENDLGSVAEHKCLWVEIKLIPWQSTHALNSHSEWAKSDAGFTLRVHRVTAWDSCFKCSRPCLCNGVANTGRGHSCSVIMIQQKKTEREQEHNKGKLRGTVLTSRNLSL